VVLVVVPLLLLLRQTQPLGCEQGRMLVSLLDD